MSGDRSTNDNTSRESPEILSRIPLIHSTNSKNNSPFVENINSRVTSRRNSNLSSVGTKSSTVSRTSLSYDIHRPHHGDGQPHCRVATLVLNTLCSVMGAGILSLPYAMYNGSVVIALLVLSATALFAAFSVFIIVHACEVTNKFSYTEVLSFALFPEEPLDAAKSAAASRETQKNGTRSPTGTIVYYDSDNYRATCPRTTAGSLRKEGEGRAGEQAGEIENEGNNDFDDAVSMIGGPDDDEGIYLPGHETSAHYHRRITTMAMEMAIVLSNFGVLIIYSRVIADTVPDVLTYFGVKAGVVTSSWMWLLLPSVALFIFSCARRLDELKWTSLMGISTIFYIVCAVLVRYFTNTLTRKITNAAGSNDVAWCRIALPCFTTVSSCALAFGYHFNVPYFYSELQDRRPGVMMKSVAIAFPIVLATNATTGLLGYLMFGALVAESRAAGNIVNNFPTTDLPMNIGRIGVFLHFLSVYPILSVSARRGLHRFICLLCYRPKACTTLLHDNDSDGGSQDEHTRQEQLQQQQGMMMTSVNEPAPGDPATTTTLSIVLEALFLVTCGTVVAACVPGIGVLVTLFGTLFGIPITLTLPGLMGLCIFRPGVLPLMASGVSNVRHIFFYRVLSAMTVVFGLLATCCSLAAFIYNTSVNGQ